MYRIADMFRGRGSIPDPDAELLRRFARDRDEAAFAEVVRRHGPLVWGVCRRRLTNPADAEDAFQATFLVLVRRARSVAGHPAVGPWLHRVAVLTAGGVRRRNRRRPTVPMAVDVPAAAPDADARLDVDAAVDRLPDRYRGPVVLCHLQGLTRREAADRLGLPEGTLSARLNRALGRLRAQLGAAAAVAVVAVPAGVASAAGRAVGVELTAAGVSPAVGELTREVLRMFWVKKAVAGVLAAAVGLAAVGAAVRSGSVTAADATATAADERKRLEDQIADLEKQQKATGDKLAELTVARQALDDRDAKERETAFEKALGVGKEPHVRVYVSGGEFRLAEYDLEGKKIGTATCDTLAMLGKLLGHMRADPAGPRRLAVFAGSGVGFDRVKGVLEGCRAAGYAHVSLTEWRDQTRYLTTKDVVVRQTTMSYLKYNHLRGEPGPVLRVNLSDLDAELSKVQKAFEPKK